MPKFVEGFAATLRVPAGERDFQVFDDDLPGFGIRKFASGRASYFVKYNLGAKQRRLTLGAVVRGNLADMRKAASKVLSKARLGQDAVAEKRAAIRKGMTLGELVPLYLKQREVELRPRSHVEVKRHIERDWKPLHGSTVDTITRGDVVRVVDEIAESRGAVAADRARTALSTFFAWAIDRSHLDANPTLNIRARSAEPSRSHVLTESELVEVWRSCLDNGHGRIVRLLILTAQRRTEIGDLGWLEINKAARQIELPEARTKNGRAHVVPLSTEALEVLADADRGHEREFVFGRGAGGFSGWSRAKAELDARIAAARAEAGVRKLMAAWVLHDIRRSVVTHMNERGFGQPHVIEAICNHVSGHKGGVAGIYNRATYLPEKRQALDLWGQHMAELIEGQESNVVAMRR